MRVLIRLPAPLQAMVGAPPEVALALADGADLAVALDALRSSPAPLPLVESKIRDETGELRQHVNVFVDGVDVRRGAGTGTVLRDGATVIVLSAVSGG